MRSAVALAFPTVDDLAAKATTELAQECASAVANDFDGPCLRLLGCDLETRASEDWLGVRTQLAMHERCAPNHDRNVLMYAALVGLARGGSAEAFEYAERRKIAGTPLIELELLTSRLFAVALNETVAELQFGRLCDALDDDSWRREVDAQHEIRRAVLTVLAENVQVRGGHGIVQRQGAGKRLEIGQALLRRVASGTQVQMSTPK